MIRARALLPASILLLSSLAAIGCSDDTYETVSLQNPDGDKTLVDDTAPPKPARDESLTFTDRNGREVNNSEARYRFDVAAFRNDEERLDAKKLFPSHAAHLAAHPGAIPSVQTIGTIAKQLDDSIYAGVEHSIQDGLGATVLPKRSILEGALDYLVTHRSGAADEAIVHVAAALRLGGAPAAVPADLEARVAAAISDFEREPALSKPIGFYTWSNELGAIWKQDRFLQKEIVSGDASCALATAIASDPARKARYESLLALVSRLTNPLHSSLAKQVTDAAGGKCNAPEKPAAFLSSSKSAEVALFEKLYPYGIPAGANLMQDLIAAIRDGRVDLAPKAGDGWYQHQQFALETLLVTDKSEERSKVAFTGKYKKRLQEAFETMLVQHRETHVKQLDVASTTSAPMANIPEFRLEPMATVYVRHARSYVFLEAALDEAYGKDLLDKGVAVSAGGAESETLRARIRRVRDLFYGLYIDSAYDIGMKPKLESKGDPEKTEWATLGESADKWLANTDKDPVAKADVRVMIPIASVGGGKMKYWAVVGVRTTLASYSYLEGDTVAPPKDPKDEARIALATEQFLEVTSTGVPLSRDEFRALCDQNVTAEAIKAALEKR